MSRHFGVQTSTARKIIGQATLRPVDHHAKRMLRTEGNPLWTLRLDMVTSRDLTVPVGQHWMANGPHPYNAVSGVRNSVDFGRTSGAGTVVAAAAGTVSM